VSLSQITELGQADNSYMTENGPFPRSSGPYALAIKMHCKNEPRCML
jgi:hypothetical protein